MNDAESQELIQVVLDRKKKDLRIRNSDGMLMQGNQMYVPNIEELKKDILDEAHVSAYAMHPRNTKMYHTIRPFYYWPGMKREIAEYVSRYVVCQQVKAKSKRPFGLLQPLPVPQWKWEDITMDFVYKLPYTQNVYDVTYKLELPPELSKVHDVFHVSMRRYYVSDPSHMIPPQLLEINPDLSYDEEPVMILDWKDNVLRNKTVSIVKVLWKNHLVEEATWETEERMRDLYPYQFYDYQYVLLCRNFGDEGF
ncbi:uncharacterized protein [Pyrus communis]|uniref:uncharacterized protein n=1 Tax=Pyrus communis TaxID=23211 RepID=UPI0035C07A50